MYRVDARPTRIELEPTRAFSVNGEVIEFAWKHDENQVYAATADGELCRYDTQQKKKVWSSSMHSTGVSSLSLSANGALLASCGLDDHLYLYETESGTVLQDERLPAWGERARFSPDGAYLAVACGRQVRLFRCGTDSVELSEVFDSHASTVTDIAWDPGSQRIAATAYGAVSVWPIEYPVNVRRFEWKGSSLCVAWSPEARFLATGDQDATVHFWFVESGTDLQMYGYENKVRELSWDSSGRYLATGGGRVACIWDCEGKKGPENTRPLELMYHSEKVRALQFAHHDRIVATGDGLGMLAIWDPFDDIGPLEPVDRRMLPDAVSVLSFSPADRYLAVGCADGTVFLYQKCSAHLPST